MIIPRRVVESEFHFPNEEWEVFLEATMVQFESPFCKSPEVLYAVYMHLFMSKGLLMVYTSMLKTFESKAVIDLVTVAIDPGLGSYVGLDCPIKGNFIKTSRKDHPDLTLSLQKPENRDLSACSTATLALSYTPEVGLVHLDLSGEFSELSFPVPGDAFTDKGIIPEHGLTIKPQVPCYTGRGNHEPEKSCYLPDSTRSKPSVPGPGRKLLTALLTLPAAIGEFVMSSVATVRAYYTPLSTWRFYGYSFLTT